MTRYVMVADLNRCVGCQTCTAACKHTNATGPDIQWRKVLDVEMGEYPDVRRMFVPVGCQHCADPPCMHVCPSTATAQRDDGIVTLSNPTFCPLRIRVSISAMGSDMLMILFSLLATYQLNNIQWHYTRLTSLPCSTQECCPALFLLSACYVPNRIFGSNHLDVR